MRCFSVLMVCLMASWAVAQDSKPDSATTVAESDFRKLVVEEAADFASPAQEQAVQIVLSRQYQDKAFDQPIRDAMSIDEDSTHVWNQVTVALNLMPYSTLSLEEQARLMLDVLLQEQDRFTDLSSRYTTATSIWKLKADRSADAKKRIPVTDLVSRLDNQPEILSKELAKRFKKQDASQLLCAAASLTREHGSELIPHLMSAAKSAEPGVKVAAMEAINQILAASDKERTQAKRQAERKADIDDRLLKYAERLVARYDTSGDRELTQDEWGKMLMSPVPADTDGNLRITVEEYARWMQSRQKK